MPLVASGVMEVAAVSRDLSKCPVAMIKSPVLMKEGEEDVSPVDLAHCTQIFPTPCIFPQ